VKLWKRDPARKKRGAQLPRQIALGLLDQAIGRVERASETRTEDEEQPSAVRYEEVCTGQGRKRHKRLPGESGVLCGWPASEWHPADPSLQECRPCGLAVLAEGGSDETSGAAS